MSKESSKPLHALFVEDSENDALLLARELHRGGYALTYVCVGTREAMQEELARETWDIVFSDFTMPQFNAFDVLAELQKTGLDVPFIIVSGTIGEDRAVMAMKAGAHDYVLKGNLTRLLPAVDRELREALNRRQHKQAGETARYLAYFDPLTNLPNRIRFHEETQRAIDDCLREQRPLALLLMDVDRFKDVNDTLGHQHGDDMLRQIGLRLRKALFEPDVVARLGGDEFGILLPRLAAEEHIEIVISKLLGTLAAPVMIEGIPVAVEVSIGVAFGPEHATDANDLLRRADVAMYRAKRTGSGYCLYSPEHDSYSPQRLVLIAELRDAIERQQLLLHYQPVIDLETGQLVATEALVRWSHPQRGLIMPNAFIGIAEHTGLIKPLTHWVIAAALRDRLQWRDERNDLKVSVNLSARSLHDPQLPAQVEELLRNANTEPAALTLEITESAIILEPRRAMETLSALNRIGVGLSIDDFGTGYTSISHIKKLPVNEIKIDKSFILNMLRDEDDATIVRSINDLGHHFGLKVVAEGVESKEILELLRLLGCDYAQGYAISHPLPITEFAAFARESRVRTRNA